MTSSLCHVCHYHSFFISWICNSYKHKRDITRCCNQETLPDNRNWTTSEERNQCFRGFEQNIENIQDSMISLRRVSATVLLEFMLVLCKGRISTSFYVNICSHDLITLNETLSPRVNPVHEHGLLCKRISHIVIDEGHNK